MNARPACAVLVGACALALAGCGEKPQVMTSATKKPESAPWTLSEAANPAFTVPGWTVGDATSWEQQIRQRNQAQNDYAGR